MSANELEGVSCGVRAGTSRGTGAQAASCRVPATVAQIKSKFPGQE